MTTPGDYGDGAYSGGPYGGARAGQLAAQLTSAGIPATNDAAKIGALAPAVLVPPPVLTFDSNGPPSATWRLLAVASSADPLTAWAQIDALVADVAQLLPVERAEPTAFAPTADANPLPAYALTIND